MYQIEKFVLAYNKLAPRKYKLYRVLAGGQFHLLKTSLVRRALLSDACKLRENYLKQTGNRIPIVGWVNEK